VEGEFAYSQVVTFLRFTILNQSWNTACIRKRRKAEAAVEQDQSKEQELTEVEIRQLRRMLHDLSSVFTGILVSGGLLNMALEGDKRQRYSEEICEGAERGADMVRHARALLTVPEQRMDELPLASISANGLRTHQ
jgi:hypothetical protein